MLLRQRWHLKVFFYDPRDKKKYKLSRFIIATLGDITKPAKEQIYTQLANRDCFADIIDFWDGDYLISLIRKLFWRQFIDYFCILDEPIQEKPSIITLKTPEREYDDSEAISIDDFLECNHYRLGNVSINMLVQFNALDNPLKDGQISIFPKLHTYSDFPKYILPSDMTIQNFRKQIREEAIKKRSQGQDSPFDNPCLKISWIERPTQQKPNEPIFLNLFCEGLNYFDFLAFNRNLDRRITGNTTLRDIYMHKADFSHIIQDKAAGIMGVSILIIIRDREGEKRQGIFTFRGATDVVANNFHVSVAEGMAPAKGDKDPFDTAIRGTTEELGFYISRNDVTFLRLFYNADSWQYELVGFVEIECSGREIFEIISRKSTDIAKENKNVLILPIPNRPEIEAPDNVISYLAKSLSEKKKWSPHAVACLFSYLEYLHKNNEKMLINCINRNFPDKKIIDMRPMIYNP